MNVPPGQHPTPQDLTAFALGKLQDTAAEVVAAHLEACPHCQHVVESVPPDSFVTRVQEARDDLDASPSSTPLPAALAPTRTTPRTEVPSRREVPAELANHPRYRILRELGR